MVSSFHLFENLSGVRSFIVTIFSLVYVYFEEEESILCAFQLFGEIQIVLAWFCPAFGLIKVILLV